MAMGNLQRIGDAPESMKERPLEIQCQLLPKKPAQGRNKNCFFLQFKPVCDDDTEDVQCELNGNETTAGGMLSCLCCPHRDNSIERTGAKAINETSCVLNVSTANELIQLFEDGIPGTHRKSSKHHSVQTLVKQPQKRPKQHQLL